LLALLFWAALAGGADAGLPKRTVNADSLIAEASKAIEGGQFEDAARQFNVVLARESGNTQARFGLATAYREMGWLLFARRHYRLALSGDPKNARWVARCRVQIGLCWELAGDYREALAEYQLALKADPAYGDAEAGRTRALASRGD
jgi:Tfp pilus assembly protein PilF